MPENVRLIITCRAGRLPELQLPADFFSLPLGGFGESETAEFVNIRRPSAPVSQAWIADLNRLSGGNARVIGYALKYGEETSQDPLDYLNPHGKDLPKIFEDRSTDALRRGGDMISLGRLPQGGHGSSRESALGSKRARNGTLRHMLPVPHVLHGVVEVGGKAMLGI